MASRRQLSVFLANRPGALSRVGEAFREAGINIQGITVADAVDHAVVRMVVDMPAEAIDILEERGGMVFDEYVLEVSLPNRPGAFAELAAKLADEDINIDYAYGTLQTKEATGATLYLHVTDLERAERVLADFLAAS
jgi:hypothetical protein